MSDFTFEGFEPANTTPVPDVLFDVLLSELNESELKVLLYIIRRTAGFKKQTDAISLTQFQKGIRKRATGEILDRGCGVKDRATIVKALASLEKKGCIQADKANDPQGDKATSTYRIRFRSEVVGKTNHPTDIGSGQNQLPWFAKPTTGSGQNQPGVVGDSNPQETVIQPNSEQETEKQEGTSHEDHAATFSLHSPTPALVSHPEYGFLWFDSLLAPTTVTVKMTPAFPDPMYSEYEDKRREGILKDLLAMIEAKGVNLTVKWEHETLQDVCESGREYPSQQDSYSHPNGQATAQGDTHGHTHDTADSATHPVHSDLSVENMAGDRRRDRVPARTARQEATDTRIGDTHGDSDCPASGLLRPDLHGGAVAPGHDAPAGESGVSDRSLAAASAQRGDHPAQGTPERGRGKATRSDSGQPGDTPVAGSGGRIEKGEQHFSTGRNSFPQQSGKASARTERRKGKKTEEPEPEPIVLSPEAEKIWRAWCSLFTVEVELIPSNAKAAEKLVKPARVWCGKLHWTLAQWLKAIKDNAYAADNKGYYSKRGVKLFDIPRELEGWQSAKEHELSTLAQAANPKPAEPPPVNPTLEALRQQRLHYTGVMS